MTKNYLDIEIKNHEVTRNYEEGTITALDGRFTFTPEMAEDMHAYYNITPDDLISFVKEAALDSEASASFDVRVTMLPAFRRTVETIFKMSVVERTHGLTLRTVYFATIATKKAEPLE